MYNQSIVLCCVFSVVLRSHLTFFAQWGHVSHRSLVKEYYRFFVIFLEDDNIL